MCYCCNIGLLKYRDGNKNNVTPCSKISANFFKSANFYFLKNLCHKNMNPPTENSITIVSTTNSMSASLNVFMVISRDFVGKIGTVIWMKIKNKKIIIIFGYCISLYMHAFLFLTFLAAYFSPTKSLLITINTFNEADIELVVLTIVMLFSVGGFMFLWQKFYKK